MRTEQGVCNPRWPLVHCLQTNVTEPDVEPDGTPLVPYRARLRAQSGNPGSSMLQRDATNRVARLGPISRAIWQPWLQHAAERCYSQGCQIRPDFPENRVARLGGKSGPIWQHRQTTKWSDPCSRTPTRVDHTGTEEQDHHGRDGTVGREGGEGAGRAGRRAE